MWIIPFSVAVEPVLDFNLAGAIEEACRRAGLSKKALAILMGIDGQLLAHQLNGRGHLSLRRLLFVARDPDGKRFLRELFVILGEHLGIEDLDAVAARLSGVMNLLQKRMARADIRKRDERKRA